MLDKAFNEKTVVITGAAGGFGSLLAQRLFDADAKLLLCDRSEEGLVAVSNRLGGIGERIQIRVCDVTQEDQVSASMDFAVAQFGAIDIAVNNAGMSTTMNSFIHLSEKEFDLNLAVNLKGVFFGMKHQLRHLLNNAHGGIILNVASKAGVGGAPSLAAYSAAKHGVIGLTKTAALEFAKKNIRVNAICPYYSPTPMVVNGIEQSLLDRLAQNTPYKRLARVEEIVDAMVMLLSPASSYMTGQAIVLDGGLSAG
ncbi:MAG: SDR family NAD(P)-dependent oxidoreductase [Spongiibacteraceae bacterium]